MTDSNGTTKPSWLGGLPASGFTPPSAVSTIAPAQPSETEHRPAKSLRRSKGPKKQRTHQNPQCKPGKLGTVLLSMLVVVLLVAGGLMIWKAFNPDGVEAPLPASEFEIPAEGVAAAVGPIGEAPVELDNGKSMTAADMAPDTLFIPALGVYMPVGADASFVKSVYRGFETLKVPKNVKHGVWYAGGAPMYGGENGVTLIASHASSKTGWGALRYLYKLTGGEMIYTKDAAGQLHSWQLTKMRVENHKAFPQEYWSAEGDRVLVLTTCGGKVNKYGTFAQNIFAVAVPVDPKPKTPEQLAAEGVIASIGALAVQRHTEAMASAELEKQAEAEAKKNAEAEAEAKKKTEAEAEEQQVAQPEAQPEKEPAKKVEPPVTPAKPVIELEVEGQDK
jgi:hypothetical protein